MRRLTAWIGGAASGIAAYRFLRRQRAATAPGEPEAAPAADERAEELRAKLAETRSPEPVIEEAPAEPPPVAEVAEPEPESPEERRHRVHQEGRAAVDEMKSE